MLPKPQKDFDTCVYSFSETLGVADIGVGKVELPEIKLVTWQEKIQGQVLPGAKYHVPSTRCQVPNTSYQVPGAKYQVPGTR